MLDVCKQKFVTIESGLLRHSKRLYAIWATIIGLVLAGVAALHAVAESRLSIVVFGEHQVRMEKALEAATETHDAVIRIETKLEAIEKTLNHEGN